MVKLRCKTPEVVHKEILAHLLAYKLPRTVMAVAADRERHRATARKKLRLQEARRLMLNQDFDAAQAAFRVGYDDASQFNRQYKRHFGKLPMHDVEQLRELSGPSTIS